MNSNYKSKLIIILSIIVVISSIGFLRAGPTGFLVGSGYMAGVPSSCTPHISLNATSSIDIPPGGFGEIEVVVWNVSCGISYVRLRLDDIPKDYYTVSPTYITAISPFKAETFTVNFDIPLNVEEKTYVGTYRLYANEGRFAKGELELNIKLEEKPKVEASVPSSQLSKGTEKIAEGDLKPTTSGNSKFWYAVSFGAAIVAIILVISGHILEAEQVPLKTKSKKEIFDVLEKETKKKAKGRVATLKEILKKSKTKK